MRTLDRYIFKEVLGPFIFGLGAFTILFFSVETLGGVARMISNIPFMQIMEYLACRLPQVLVFTFPMATLMACLLAFGRLSGEAELTALRASGLSFLRIATPALVFFFLISGFNYWLNDAVVPKNMKRAYEILIESQKKNHNEVVKTLLTTPKVLENGMEQMIYAHKFDLEAKTMKGVYIHYFLENRRTREIYAEKAEWIEEEEVWRLWDMREVEYDVNERPLRETTALEAWTGMQPEDSPPSPTELGERKLRPEEMTRAELAHALVELAHEIRLGGGSTSERAIESKKEMIRQRDRYAVMYHQKASLPWVSFIFATFAIPLGVRPHRSSKSMGLGLSLVFILIYYVLMTVGLVLGEAGTLDPMIGAWLPNLIFGIMGVVLLFQASRN